MSPSTPLHRLSATEAMALVQSDKVTMVEYVTSLLDRIKERDPVVQAWIYLSPEQVLRKATELDELPKDKRGPLHGMCIGVKDVFLTKDMPTTYKYVHCSSALSNTHCTFSIVLICIEEINLRLMLVLSPIFVHLGPSSLASYTRPNSRLHPSGDL